MSRNKKHPLNVHEIRYDTLCRLLSDIKREGKGKLNVMYCLRRCLDYAWKSSRIIALPPFPEKRLYEIEPKPISMNMGDQSISSRC